MYVLWQQIWPAVFTENVYFREHEHYSSYYYFILFYIRTNFGWGGTLSTTTLGGKQIASIAISSIATPLAVCNLIKLSPTEYMEQASEAAAQTVEKLETMFALGAIYIH